MSEPLEEDNNITGYKRDETDLRAVIQHAKIDPKNLTNISQVNKIFLKELKIMQ